MPSGTSWASAGMIPPTTGKAAATAVKRRAFRRLRVMFIVRSCGSGGLPRARQSGRTPIVTKLAEGKAKETTKFGIAERTRPSARADPERGREVEGAQSPGRERERQQRRREHHGARDGVAAPADDQRHVEQVVVEGPHDQLAKPQAHDAAQR